MLWKMFNFGIFLDRVVYVVPFLTESSLTIDQSGLKSQVIDIFLNSITTKFTIHHVICIILWGHNIG